MPPYHARRLRRRLGRGTAMQAEVERLSETCSGGGFKLAGCFQCGRGGGREGGSLPVVEVGGEERAVVCAGHGSLVPLLVLAQQRVAN